MRHAIFAIVLALLQLGSAPGIAAEQSASDISMKMSSYRWWHALSPGAKETALRSAIVGIAGGWLDGYREGRTDAESALGRAEVKGAVPREAATIVENGPYPAPPHFSKSLTAYRRSVDEFYMNNRDKRTTNVFLVLLCFADNPACDASKRR